MYVGLGSEEVPVAGSPKSQAYVSIGPPSGGTVDDRSVNVVAIH